MSEVLYKTLEEILHSVRGVRAGGHVMIRPILFNTDPLDAAPGTAKGESKQ